MTEEEVNLHASASLSSSLWCCPIRLLKSPAAVLFYLLKLFRFLFSHFSLEVAAVKESKITPLFKKHKFCYLWAMFNDYLDKHYEEINGNKLKKCMTVNCKKNMIV